MTTTDRFTEDQITAEMRAMKRRYTDLFPEGEEPGTSGKWLRHWAIDELQRAWRAERQYDHTTVTACEPGSLGYDPARPQAEITGHTMPPGSDHGQGWVMRLSHAELIEVRDQINAYLDAS